MCTSARKRAERDAAQSSASACPQMSRPPANPGDSQRCRITLVSGGEEYTLMHLVPIFFSAGVGEILLGTFDG